MSEYFYFNEKTAKTLKKSVGAGAGVRDSFERFVPQGSYIYDLFLKFCEINSDIPDIQLFSQLKMTEKQKNMALKEKLYEITNSDNVKDRIESIKLIFELEEKEEKRSKPMNKHYLNKNLATVKFLIGDGKTPLTALKIAGYSDAEIEQYRVEAEKMYEFETATRNEDSPSEENTLQVSIEVLESGEVKRHYE